MRVCAWVCVCVKIQIDVDCFVDLFAVAAPRQFVCWSMGVASVKMLDG